MTFDPRTIVSGHPVVGLSALLDPAAPRISIAFELRNVSSHVVDLVIVAAGVKYGDGFVTRVASSVTPAHLAPFETALVELAFPVDHELAKAVLSDYDRGEFAPIDLRGVEIRGTVDGVVHPIATPQGVHTSRNAWHSRQIQFMQATGRIRKSP